MPPKKKKKTENAEESTRRDYYQLRLKKRDYLALIEAGMAKGYLSLEDVSKPLVLKKKLEEMILNELLGENRDE